MSETTAQPESKAVSQKSASRIQAILVILIITGLLVSGATWCYRQIQYSTIEYVNAQLAQHQPRVKVIDLKQAYLTLSEKGYSGQEAGEYIELAARIAQADNFTLVTSQAVLFAPASMRLSLSPSLRQLRDYYQQLRTTDPMRFPPVATQVAIDPVTTTEVNEQMKQLSSAIRSQMANDAK
ncbi:hypothetical protein IC617_08225 [Neiella sp. HB171785]|uniref:Uncharacterized protein n=1 Tax=Neiella litorisoli TaxID=2771431 RepID=A0A8J6R2R9_9GAMM|nr:hypothetical protein [Neiella litorisoli]MBD1389410.1 hypothetical protein [Neiella litorisoli]